jgi:hypothetical protein
MNSAALSSIDKSHYARMGLPLVGNAFTGCVPRSTAPDSCKPPAKRGPNASAAQQAASALRTDAEREADKLARATAYQPGAHNYAPNPTPSKPVSTAGRRFATV